MSRQQLLLDAVRRGKYARLYEHLSQRSDTEWCTTFSELETILGFALPNSAHIYRPWWANDTGSGHSQSLAWVMAGWRTAKVNLDDQTLIFKRHSGEQEDRPMLRSAPIQRDTAPTMEDFRAALKAHLMQARASGADSVTIRSGDLHRVVGGYPTPFNRMPMCCTAMYEEQRGGDQTLHKPDKNYGASLTIEYRLPRH